MADLSPPSRFSKVAHQWVHKNKDDSIFYVNMIGKPHCHQQIFDYLMETFEMTDKEAETIILKPKSTTGFMIYRDGDTAYILTCCHLLEEFYSDQIELIEHQVKWFRFWILCKHNEHHMATSNPDLYELENDPRNYTLANVVKFDHTKDLLLLQVNMANVYANERPIRSLLSHQPLELAKHVPSQLDDVVMISWPPYLCDTVASGEVSNLSRSYIQLTRMKTTSYNMNLMELNIIGDDGCSGSPVLNHHGHVVALYHGRIHGKGYAVSLADIDHFLERG